MSSIEFPGTLEERIALQLAVEKYGGHQLLNPKDNRWAHLVFARRMASKLLLEELGPQEKMVPAPKYTLKQIAMIDRIAKTGDY